MPLAVDLDKIRLYTGKKGIDLGLSERPAGIGDVLAGMEIEMNAKKTIRSFKLLDRISGLGG